MGTLKVFEACQSNNVKAIVNILVIKPMKTENGFGGIEKSTNGWI